MQKRTVKTSTIPINTLNTTALKSKATSGNCFSTGLLIECKLNFTYRSFFYILCISFISNYTYTCKCILIFWY